MSATIERSVDVVDNYLMHYGVPGQKRGQHDPNRRWQSHAVYAQGRPNPDAKVRGEKDRPRVVTKQQIEAKQDINKAKSMYSKYPSKELRNLTNSLIDTVNKGDRKGIRTAQKDLVRFMKKADYAQGMPNPDAKVRGERDGVGNEWYKDGFGRKQIGRASGARMNDTAMLERKIREKSTDELRNATNRLRAENDLKKEIINMNRLNKEYEEALHADEGKAIKNFRNALSWMARSKPAKIAMNTMYYSAYEAMANKYGKDKAGAMFNGVINSGGGKKNKNK